MASVSLGPCSTLSEDSSGQQRYDQRIRGYIMAWGSHANHSATLLDLPCCGTVDRLDCSRHGSKGPVSHFSVAVTSPLSRPFNILGLVSCFPVDRLTLSSPGERSRCCVCSHAVLNATGLLTNFCNMGQRKCLRSTGELRQRRVLASNRQSMRKRSHSKPPRGASDHSPAPGPRRPS